DQRELLREPRRAGSSQYRRRRPRGSREPRPKIAGRCARSHSRVLWGLMGVALGDRAVSVEPRRGYHRWGCNTRKQNASFVHDILGPRMAARSKGMRWDGAKPPRRPREPAMGWCEASEW